MKYLLIFTFFCFSFNLKSQDHNYYEVLYNTKSMILNTYKKPKEALASLYIYKNNSIFQWERERQLDSIRAKREINNEDLNRYFSKEKYAIEIKNNKLKYFDYFGDNEYQYEEDINYNWDIKTQTKNIKGYKCKKATLSYGGREWVAWYAIDLPINSGPYKFKGLPGLILKINDSTNSYDFEVSGIYKRKYLPLKKLYHHKEANDRVKTDRMKFNEIKFKYKSLSFQERMDLLNNKQGTTNILEFSNSNGANPFSNERNVNRAKRNNFIEIDHKKY